MIHPPCDAVRVHLAKLQHQELFAHVARERRAQEIHVPSMFSRITFQLVRLVG